MQRCPQHIASHSASTTSSAPEVPDTTNWQLLAATPSTSDLHMHDPGAKAESMPAGAWQLLQACRVHTRQQRLRLW